MEQMAVGGQDGSFVLAKTEIPVFGPEQNHPARGGEIAIILTSHVLRIRLEHGLGLFGARVPEFELRPKSWTQIDGK